MGQFGDNQVGGSQFGGSTPSNDDYGFFAPARTSGNQSQFGAAPAPSQFGTATAPSQFGGPAPAPFGSAAGYAGHAPPKTSSSSPSAKAMIGSLILVVVLAVGAWFAWGVYQRGRPIVMPPSLGGLTPATAKPLLTVRDEALAGIRSENEGVSVDGQLYGNRDKMAVLLVGRGSLDVSGEWRDAAVTSPAPIGKSECADIAVAELKAALCIRSSRNLGVEVLLLGGDVNEAAQMLDDAWALQ